MNRIGCIITCGSTPLRLLIPAVLKTEIETIEKEITETAVVQLFSLITDGTMDDGVEMCAVVTRYINKDTFMPVQRLSRLSMLGHPMKAVEDVCALNHNICLILHA